MNECGGQSVTEVSKEGMSEAIPDIYMLAMVLSKYKPTVCPLGWVYSAPPARHENKGLTGLTMVRSNERIALQRSVGRYISSRLCLDCYPAILNAMMLSYHVAYIVRWTSRGLVLQVGV